MTETTESPDIYYGAMEGGHVVSVKSFENIGEQAALVLAEKESGLTEGMRLLARQMGGTP